MRECRAVATGGAPLRSPAVWDGAARTYLGNRHHDRALRGQPPEVQGSATREQPPGPTFQLRGGLQGRSARSGMIGRNLPKLSFEVVVGDSRRLIRWRKSLRNGCKSRESSVMFSPVQFSKTGRDAAHLGLSKGHASCMPSLSFWIRQWLTLWVV